MLISNEHILCSACNTSKASYQIVWHHQPYDRWEGYKVKYGNFSKYWDKAMRLMEEKMKRLYNIENILWAHQQIDEDHVRDSVLFHCCSKCFDRRFKQIAKEHKHDWSKIPEPINEEEIRDRQDY
jgi:mRNA-degrading endonuclease YafQ of YafQ-DinJ toxin-antitoxin module